MAVADGKRVAVYDVTVADWDQPVIDLAAGQLRERFDDLLGVLGAAQVAARVRERQLRHLGSAMRAELDPVRLDETVDAVRQIAREARPSVIENRRRVLVDQHERENADRDELVRSSGVWGIAQMHNQPVSDNLRDADRAAEYVSSLPDTLRSRELDLFVEAARPTIDTRTGEELAEPGEPRMFWFLRVLALATYLRLRSTPGVGDHAEQLARTAVRDHLLDFPDDPLARAAHRLERVLPPFTLRMALSLDQVDMPAAAQRMRVPMDDERRLRAGVDGDELLLRTVILSARRTFASLDWDEATLNQGAETLERLVPKIQYPTDSAMGQAHDPFMEFYLAVDPLVHCTLLVVGSEHTDLLDDECERVVRQLAETADGPLGKAVGRVVAAIDDTRKSPDPVSAGAWPACAPPA